MKTLASFSFLGSRSQQQKAVISAIKRRQYQVIVSTDNINEELPHCELVVLLDQLTSVSVLHQLRTRRATNVVAISPDDNGEENLKELLKKEELVERAISCMRWKYIYHLKSGIALCHFATKFKTPVIGFCFILANYFNHVRVAYISTYVYQKYGQNVSYGDNSRFKTLFLNETIQGLWKQRFIKTDATSQTL